MRHISSKTKNRLAHSPREPTSSRGFDFKKSIVNTILSLMRNVPETNRVICCIFVNSLKIANSLHSQLKYVLYLLGVLKQQLPHVIYLIPSGYTYVRIDCLIEKSIFIKKRINRYFDQSGID